VICSEGFLREAKGVDDLSDSNRRRRGHEKVTDSWLWAEKRREEKAVSKSRTWKSRVDGIGDEVKVRTGVTSRER